MGRRRGRYLTKRDRWLKYRETELIALHPQCKTLDAKRISWPLPAEVNATSLASHKDGRKLTISAYGHRHEEPWHSGHFRQVTESDFWDNAGDEFGPEALQIMGDKEFYDIKDEYECPICRNRYFLLAEYRYCYRRCVAWLKQRFMDEYVNRDENEQIAA